ncbi:PREDICTED: poly(A)-specific ribonuclease PARN-like domain-containing protein 1 isoform X2 [Polistes dominula]|uniref:Poly(A)-specific ribonuclease PARN-like domain-containing protein 1 isoform X2 n=1 Tax=Polistes dominula TaxID=743375 RepID=A0ABM1I1K8_POLDO|nr:PREDICTED: poly(A)-specific ribonuclease PARN-like domain-containing protein 1 isoform X2 [Polistes dominula]
MIEVTKENFAEIYPQLKDDLENADVIAIDTEFTGLDCDEISKISLFDTTEERYKYLRNTLKPFIIIQFGITVLKRIQDKNEYISKSYEFYLLPTSVFTKNKIISWQISVIEFLSYHSFNFNKVVNHGISYLNQIEEAMLNEQWKNDTFYKNVEDSMSYQEKDDVNLYSSLIAEWLKDLNEKEIYTIPAFSHKFQYFLQKTLRERFQNIWTICNKQTVQVIKISLDVRKMLENEKEQSLEHALLNSYVGFSNVFKLLVELKKPIIGHNILLDLMFMYKLFYKPLPKRYCDFKTEVNHLFPIIYDTKYIFHQVKEKYEIQVLSSLGSIYCYFNNLAKSFPHIADDTNNTSKNFHNAGWDSYCTGYIFLKMAYMFANDKYPLSSNYIVSQEELMSLIEEYANCINLSNASALYLKLDGKDPKSGRPPWLFVKTRESTYLDINFQRIIAIWNFRYKTLQSWTCFGSCGESCERV